MPGILEFKVSEVEREIALAKAGTPETLYDEITGPGLWLVGDQGVYLMSNAKRNGIPASVAYAAGCAPGDPDFYDNKVDIFGGDDGVDFFPLALMESWVAQAKKQSKATCKIDVDEGGYELVTAS